MDLETLTVGKHFNVKYSCFTRMGMSVYPEFHSNSPFTLTIIVFSIPSHFLKFTQNNNQLFVILKYFMEWTYNYSMSICGAMPQHQHKPRLKSIAVIV